jgi:hypothetical protein
VKNNTVGQFLANMRINYRIKPNVGRGVSNTDSKGPSTLLVLVLQPIHTTSKYTDPHAPKPGEQLK